MIAYSFEVHRWNRVNGRVESGRTISAVLLIFAVSLVGCTAAVVQSTPQEHQAQSGSIPEYPYELPEWREELLLKLFKPFTFSFRDVPAEKAIGQFAKKSGVNISIDSSVKLDEEYISIRLVEMYGWNILQVLLAFYGEDDLNFKLAPEGVVIIMGELEALSKTDRVVIAIERARGSEMITDMEAEYQRNMDKMKSALKSTEVREFDWKKKTVEQAILEVRAEYDLNIGVGDLNNRRLRVQTDLQQWKGNAYEALRILLGKVGLDLRASADGEKMIIHFVEVEHEAEEYYEECLGRERKFLSRVIGRKFGNANLYKLVEVLKDDYRINVYPDKTTWREGDRVRISVENPTVRELLDLLEENYSISGIYDYDFSERDDLYLIKKKQNNDK